MKNKAILVTGGAGSFGQKFIEYILSQEPKKVIVYSRDEYKHFLMEYGLKDERIVYVVGNVRDKERLIRSLQDVDIVIHAAALKQVTSCEMNPIEAVKTNIIGTATVIEACLDTTVERMVFVSTDKAVDPVSLYGATKLTAERLVIQANNYAKMFSVVRLGNIMGATGTVLPLFKLLASKREKIFPITDQEMTRFWFTAQYAAELHESMISDYEHPYSMVRYNVIIPVEEFLDYSKYKKETASGPFSSKQGPHIEVEEIKELLEE
jgi:FlaA1/EpsC-like NDP-sugar epimerase